MKKIVTSLVVIPILTVLSGCSTYSLEKLRHTTPKGSPFQNALAKLYMNFSDSEEKDYDWQDSWYFADKGLSAAYGKNVAPEDLNSWDIPANELKSLEIARRNLLAVLTPEKIKARPEIAARAQFNFDCWVEQQEENWQIDDIAACRDAFNSAVSELGGAVVKVPAKAGINSKPKDLPAKQEQKTEDKIKEKTKVTTDKAAQAEAKVAAEKAVKKPVVAATVTSFALFFEAKQIALTPAGSSTLGAIAKAIAVSEDYEVVIVDKSAGQKDNMKLSQERIQSVKKWLVEAGAKESAIKTNGKSDNEANRRIEIFLND